MANEVEICNLAIGNIRAQSIQSLDETNGLEAPACKLRYPQARDVVLADAWWKFAGQIVTLAPLADEPTEWSYAYAWPSDCIEPRYIVPPSKARERSAPIEFNVEIRQSDGLKIIVTEQPEACLKYTFRQTNTELFSPHFVEALSWWLAGSIAIPIVGTERGRAIRKDCLEIYQATIGNAIASDASIGYSVEPDPDTIEARK